MRSFTIRENDAGQRMDKFITKAVPLLPKSLMYKYLRLKRIKLNGKRCEISTRLTAGDVVEMYIGDEFFDTAPEESFRFAGPMVPIVYEDEHLLLVNKPAGLVVHEDESQTPDTLIGRILRYLAEKMTDWGVDIVIGHHPHVLQPIETRTTADGRQALIAYSLGNFISQQNTAARVIGGMLHYDMTIDPQSGSVTVGNVKFETIVTHYVNGSHDVQIYPLSEYTDALAKRQASRIKQSDFSVAYIEDFVSGVIDAEFLAS